MIKLLQKKFIITAMIAITVLIVLMLGAINAANIISVKNETDVRLHMISENFERPNDAPNKNTPKPMDDINPRLDQDRLQSSPFFTVNCDNNENIVYVDSSRIPSLTGDSIESYVNTAISNNRGQGRIGNYRYLVNNSYHPGKTIVFLDTSDEFYSYVRVLGLSATVGLVCWICMLLLVIFLSKKAIKPIAENFERQKQFVTNAGHEIKTPLAIIQTNTEALELYQGESKWSHNIKLQTVRLSSLMKNLLQLSKMEETTLTASKEEFNLCDELAKELLLFEEIFKLNHLTVIMSNDECNHLVNANKEQFNQLCAILLDNAGKYAKAGSHILVDVRKINKKTKMFIENECNEMPTDDPERLFERFYRADKARTQKSGGYGIGLSLAKAISEANKIKLDCHYLPDNKIRFTITF